MCNDINPFGFFAHAGQYNKLSASDKEYQWYNVKETTISKAQSYGSYTAGYIDEAVKVYEHAVGFIL